MLVVIFSVGILYTPTCFGVCKLHKQRPTQPCPCSSPIERRYLLPLLGLVTGPVDYPFSRSQVSALDCHVERILIQSFQHQQLDLIPSGSHFPTPATNLKGYAYTYLFYYKYIHVRIRLYMCMFYYYHVFGLRLGQKINRLAAMRNHT